jgi:AcrR family transcriptional regulator
MSRAESGLANRRVLLDAARRQFELQGYHGASLDVIAQEAGFSKGAVYSRFAGKDDLFLAVLADHIERRHDETAEREARLDDSADVVALLRQSIATSVGTVAWQAALLEFRAHAWRHPEVNARYAELHQRTIDSIAGFIGRLSDRSGRRPPMPPRELAVVALAAATGVVAEHMADPQIDVEAIAVVLARAMDAPAAAVRTEPS